MDRLWLIKAEAVDIEGTMASTMEGTGAAAAARPQFRWARPDDVEGRVEIWSRGWAFLGFQIADVKAGDVGHSCAAIESAGRRR
jgi:hypothetical protein